MTHTRRKKSLSLLVIFGPFQLNSKRQKRNCVREHQPERLAGSIGCVREGGIKNTPSPHPLLYIFIYFLLLDIVYSLSYIDKSFFPPLFFFLYPTCVCRINPPGSPDPLLTKLYIYIIHLEDEEKPSGHPNDINRTLSLSSSSFYRNYMKREREKTCQLSYRSTERDQ